MHLCQTLPPWVQGDLITVCCSYLSPAKPLILVVFALLNAQSVSNTFFILDDLTTSHNLDVLCLTEMWLEPLVELYPPTFNFFNAPRLTGCSGGVAAVF